MKKEWECKKCNHINQPDDPGFSLFKCVECGHWRWPWLRISLFIFVPAVAIILLVSIVIFINEWGAPEKVYERAFRECYKDGEISSEDRDKLNRLASKLKPGEAEGIENEIMGSGEVQIVSNPEDPKGDISIDIKFQYQRPGQLPAGPMSLNGEGSINLDGLILNHKDNYRFLVNPGRGCYLYIFQLDSEGKIDRLFPNPSYNLTGNPLEAGVEYKIPSRFVAERTRGQDNATDESVWFYLDIGEKTETIYVISLSDDNREIKAINDLYGKIHKAVEETEKGSYLKQFQEMFGALGNRPGIFTRKIRFQHSK